MKRISCIMSRILTCVPAAHPAAPLADPCLPYRRSATEIANDVAPIRGLARSSNIRNLHLLLSACLLLILPMTACAQNSPAAIPTAKESPLRARVHSFTKQEAAARQQWLAQMKVRKLPTSGCFSASFPNTEWKQAPCTSPPPRNPLPPVKRKLSPIGSLEQVGNGVDISVETNSVFWGATAPPITSAEGSFPKVVNVTSVTTTGSANNGAVGLFSLQLNSKPVSSPACANAAVPANCTVWAQFLLTSDPQYAYVYMEFWLLDFGPTCPGTGDKPATPGLPANTQWIPFENSCVIDSPSIQLPSQSIADLGLLSLRGTAAAQGDDQVTVQLADGTIYGESLSDSILNLASVWEEAEFNVFGYHGGEGANFNQGAAVAVELKIENGTSLTPIALREGFTAETNNFNLGTVGCSVGGNAPSTQFEEATVTTQLSNRCPPSPTALPPPPPLSCPVLQEGVTSAQKALAQAQARFHSAACQGPISIECEKQVQTAQQSLLAAEASYKKTCSK